MTSQGGPLTGESGPLTSQGSPVTSQSGPLTSQGDPVTAYWRSCFSQFKPSNNKVSKPKLFLAVFVSIDNYITFGNVGME